MHIRGIHLRIRKKDLHRRSRWRIGAKVNHTHGSHGKNAGHLITSFPVKVFDVWLDHGSHRVANRLLGDILILRVHEQPSPGKAFAKRQGDEFKRVWPNVPRLLDQLADGISNGSPDSRRALRAFAFDQNFAAGTDSPDIRQCLVRQGKARSQQTSHHVQLKLHVARPIA